jgi:hypothetical protein
LKGTVLEEGVATLPVEEAPALTEEAPALTPGVEVWATTLLEAGLVAIRDWEEEQAALQTLTVVVQ